MYGVLVITTAVVILAVRGTQSAHLTFPLTTVAKDVERLKHKHRIVPVLPNLDATSTNITSPEQIDEKDPPTTTDDTKTKSLTEMQYETIRDGYVTYDPQQYPSSMSFGEPYFNDDLPPHIYPTDLREAPSTIIRTTVYNQPPHYRNPSPPRHNRWNSAHI
ncbi:hypothetical protein Pmani_018653 [Petrolisthes manimaculis]|uniref:Uncharacterized protein n=1 Tax=Petrolisthes manimaculis TaxID=1843537 RepID=A0AAE1U4C0_9EUCA|nr:hypothetical protein Pmani_018653 [Petrolisthes manimaculis]